ncbi:diacylglycerol/lipid kinase family protein [Compostimonas suwonensis]|uniref:diacylglycerol/lipid kinase family protein n=1 Tax=Compostimonas suwonensis TaxID=1048394 RepID=UPI000C232C49|nr:diacylglycerol kinase family protein [Compostimonas suwonensis]
MTPKPSPDRAQAAVVYNPVKVDVARLKRAVEAAAAAEGWARLEWYETTEEDTGKLVAREAVDAGATLVLAAGGDGTVRAVASGLRDTGVAMGLIASGTGNLLARNLGLPLNSPAEAAAIAFSGTDRAIDLAIMTLTRPDETDEEHVFLVMAGLGFDAAMIASTNPTLKKRVGWLAYVDGGMRALPKIKPFRIRYQIENRPEHSVHLSQLLVANCASLPGNIEVIPDADMEDGLLDFAVMQPRGFFGWLLVWRRVTWENSVLRRSAIGRAMIKATASNEERNVTYLRGADIRVTMESGHEIELDGDEFGKAIAVHVHADPQALVVRVPA